MCNGCCEPGTGGPHLARLLQAWHWCCDLAQCPQAWHSVPKPGTASPGLAQPLAPPGSSSLAGGARRLRNPRVLWPDPPPRVTQPRSFSLYNAASRPRRASARALPASVSPRRAAPASVSLPQPCGWCPRRSVSATSMPPMPLHEASPPSSPPIPPASKNRRFGGFGGKIGVVGRAPLARRRELGRKSVKRTKRPQKIRLILRLFQLNPLFSSALGGETPPSTHNPPEITREELKPPFLPPNTVIKSSGAGLRKSLLPFLFGLRNAKNRHVWGDCDTAGAAAAPVTPRGGPDPAQRRGW